MCTSMSHFTTSLKIARVLYYVSSEFEKPPQKKRESKNKNGEPYPWGRKPYPQTYKSQAEKNKKTFNSRGRSAKHIASTKCSRIGEQCV